ncbi:rhodanese family protein [uncultured Desulfovibrio sp.]|uniref:rhodanese family protein n=1 Tax=uncultured Desulfovibrio sp. TaxID=167968 RepID=UPI00260D36CA|nr:rhodanese family protein [uncultured Desulfovibrio sp.]
MLPILSPAEAYQRFQNGEVRLVDIREVEELEALSVPGAQVLPLSLLRYVQADPGGEQDKPVVFMCNSGRRTSDNSDLLERVAGGPAWQVSGGVAGWVEAGLPVRRGKGKRRLPMARQIQIGAGSLVLLGLLGSLVVPAFALLSAFVGAGLIFAGVTGFCGMALLLQKMPWNRD